MTKILNFALRIKGVVGRVAHAKSSDSATPQNLERALGMPSAPSKFWGVAGSEDFACATLPTTPLDFQGKIKNFCHPTLLKIRFPICFNRLQWSVDLGWTFKPQVLVTHDNLFHENHFNNCI